MNTADTKASLSPVLDRLLNGEALAENEAYELMHRFAAGELDPALAESQQQRTARYGQPDNETQE